MALPVPSLAELRQRWRPWRTLPTGTLGAPLPRDRAMLQPRGSKRKSIESLPVLEVIVHLPVSRLLRFRPSPEPRRRRRLRVLLPQQRMLKCATITPA